MWQNRCAFSGFQATVSHHLKELTDAGLIEIRPEGQFRYCKARIDVLADYIHELEHRAGIKRTKKEEKVISNSPLILCPKSPVH